MPSDDPRAVRSRAAVHAAAQTLFLKKGYGGTTMDEIAERAGLTKRTLYNNYADKEALFLQIMGDLIEVAEGFAGALHAEFTEDLEPDNIRAWLGDLASRLASRILRPEVIALRRLLIGEARNFPLLASHYFDSAPGQVIAALAQGFAHLNEAGLLRVTDARAAAAQFAYLVAGEALDRAMLTGTMPEPETVLRAAADGVATFFARYGSAPALS